MTQGQIHAAFARGELTPAQTADLTFRKRQRSHRRLIVVGAVIAALVALIVVGCTSPPNPPPSGPGGAGGSAPQPPPPTVTCGQACAHADAVCPGNNCSAQCPRVVAWDPGYPACVAAATGCYNCDAVARAKH